MTSEGAKRCGDDGHFSASIRARQIRVGSRDFPQRTPSLRKCHPGRGTPEQKIARQLSIQCQNAMPKSSMPGEGSRQGAAVCDERGRQKAWKRWTFFREHPGAANSYPTAPARARALSVPPPPRIYDADLLWCRLDCLLPLPPSGRRPLRVAP